MSKTKNRVDDSQKVGITESGEISFNLEAFDNLYKANIIITKRLTDKLIEKLVENKDKCILHMTCTGYGGTVLEPLVPTYEQTYQKVKRLIASGFPVEQIVLRIDPTIPTKKGIQRVVDVVETFKYLGIKRVRFSVMDMYKHVKDRFKEASIPLPYSSFHADTVKRMEVYNTLKDLGDKYGFEVEACGEPDIKTVSCLSQKDIDILGLSDEIKLVDSAEQRSECGCPANKTEILKLGKPHRCPNKCLYCFWKDE